MATALSTRPAAAQDPVEPQATPPVAARPAADATETKPRANRLAKETSPYLLLHAHNPVDWYPWGPEALEKARREKKVIFLSIGYSSCHWCHVMERESFLDPEIAAFLNEHFVCIKVDREERPDIDAIYMTSLQVFNQLIGNPSGGGWPLTMFLTPDAEPFFGGTYFPARDGDRGQATGLLTLLRRVQEAWQQSPERIGEDAKTLTRITRRQLETQPLPTTRQLGPDLLDDVQSGLAEQFDPEYGGFGFVAEDPQRPKFPEPANLLFLLDRMQSSPAEVKSDAADTPSTSPSASELLVKTLQHLAMGGIRDHVGGGFHRYSVDRFWKIPHFEKMLYDNAQLASVYARAYQLTGDESFRRVAEETVAFVLREMQDEAGGFHSALDAESEGEEGRYYRWDRSQVRAELTKEQWDLAGQIYQFAGPPNFEDQFHVPQLAQPLAVTAEQMGLETAQLEQRLLPIRQKLLQLRSQRIRPNSDTKVLTSWNGLMITALVDVAEATKNPVYLDHAKRAAQFVLDKLRTEDGRLLATYAAEQAKLNGYLNDYAYLVEGLLALHHATGEQPWLAAAQELTDKQIELFWDEKRHGFFFTSSDHETLLARTKDFVDNVQPAGNSVAALNLLKLAQTLDRDDYRDKARQTIQAALPQLERSPTSAPRMAVAISAWLEDERSRGAK